MTATTPTYDPAEEYWADYDGADWYCSHDVPNGCDGCARVEAEHQMLMGMTPDERDEYFARFDPFDGDPF